MALSTESVIANLQPLSSPANLGQQVANRLREAIANGTLPPGTRLVERDLAAQLGISRMPVREAIQQLVDDGLVLKEPRRGAYVHTYSATELYEISSLRIVLERFVVERVMTRWSDRAAGQLHAIVDTMTRAANAGDFHRLYELDFQFHQLLWSMADHKILLEVVAELRTRINRFLLEATSAVQPDELDAHVEHHRYLIETLNSGDVGLAQQAMSDHVMLSADRIRAHYAYLDQPAAGA